MKKSNLKTIQFCLLLVTLLSQTYLSSSAPAPMPKDAKIYVAGHNGLVGKSLVRALTKRGYTNILTRSSKELDLRNQQATQNFFAREKPEYVFLAAAKVGGIYANNTYPATFAYDNLMITINVIAAAHKNNVTKLLFLSSSGAYPRNAPQPLKEDSLLSGKPEKTLEGYVIAKIAGMKLIEFYNKEHKTNFISCMPINLYGPHDNFDLKSSHVMPALIRKFCDAQRNGVEAVTLWGSGSAYREFLYVDDLADACLFLMDNYNESGPINIGTGYDISIKNLAEKIKSLVGYTGKIIWDTDKPDGVLKRQLDVSKILDLGWQPTTSFDDGIEKTISYYTESYQ